MEDELLYRILMAGFLQNHFKSREEKSLLKLHQTCHDCMKRIMVFLTPAKFLRSKIKYIHKKAISKLLTVVNEDRKNTVASQVRLIS